MNTITAGSGMLLLGRQGENNATMVQFPIKSLLDQYGEITFKLAVKRPGETIPYAVKAETDEDGYATWTISSYDTAMHGVGRCELQCFDENGTVVKSDIWVTQITESITDGLNVKNSGGGGGGDDNIATDEEVAAAFVDLFSRH